MMEASEEEDDVMEISDDDFDKAGGDVEDNEGQDVQMVRDGH